MSTNTGWTDEVEVNFDEVPDELVNLPDATYVADFTKAEPKKTDKGDQAISLVMKAASVVGGGEIPTGAKQLYATISFKPDALMNAKNLLKTLGISFPKKINFEVLTELCNDIMAARQVIVKTSTSPAQNGFAAKSRVTRYYTEETLANASASADSAVVTEVNGAAPAASRKRRGASEQAAA